jgi:aarF domain-containing kinase
MLTVKFLTSDITNNSVVMWMFENWVFDLPVYFAVGLSIHLSIFTKDVTLSKFNTDFITDHLRQELDFEREASNATRTSLLVANEPSLSEHVYIPHVYHDLTTKRIMTAEWIDGVRFSDREAVKRLMGEKSPIAEAKGGPLAPGYSGKALKGGVKDLMNVMVELFSAQMFSWGWVRACNFI